MSKIVLFLPPYPGPPLGPPLSLLCLASPLERAGFEVRIIDAAVVPGYGEAIEREVAGALCFGVSLLTGPMITAAVAAARRVKQLRPELPVVFGGWHPSLLPEQTLKESSVDIVVCHQGEVSFLEVARRLEEKASLDLVAGCWFKQRGVIHRNPPRPAAPLCSLPPPAYHLVDFDAYERATGERSVPYATSLGCPYACNYCTDTVFYRRRFNALSARRVVEEITTLAASRRLRKVALVDSNFLVDAERAVSIARGVLASGLRLEWTFQASTDLLCRLTDDEVRLLGASGVSHIGFGAESGSEQVLHLMNKRHQRVPDMFEAARKCQQAGVRVTFNIILGFPGESGADRKETMRVMSAIAARYDNVSFSPNLFTPYPGLPIWPELRKHGVKEPESLEAWAQISLGSGRLPWMQGKTGRQVRRGTQALLMVGWISKTVRRSGRFPVRLFALRLLRRTLQWRLEHEFFRWPLEVWLLRARARLAMRRSLLTGRRLRWTPENVC